MPLFFRYFFMAEVFPLSGFATIMRDMGFSFLMYGLIRAHSIIFSRGCSFMSECPLLSGELEI